MSETGGQNLGEIEGLLASRQQIMGWLERLNEAGARAPDSVKKKVEADYRARLAQVVGQLSTHGDLIATALSGLRAQTREFRQLRGEEREVRAEAELRHSVGEYTDDEWQLVELESSGKIEEFAQELARLSGEVRRLEEVQALISPAEPEKATLRLEPSGSNDRPAAEEEIVRIPDEPALTLVPDPEPELPATPQPRPEAPRFVPSGSTPKPRDSGSHRAPSRTPSQPAAAAPQDELAFLRSVTLDPGSTRLTPQASPGLAGLEPTERPSQAAAKTLKCAECGSLNRPTEWYCERCGAELAAL